MNRCPLIILLAIAACVSTLAGVQPADDTPAKTRAGYPLPYCIVSGEHLDAGQVVEYVHREPGRPDRLMRFCCRKCLARFKADPAAYLKKLDEAATKAGPKR